MAYNELIKSFRRIREYMRDFYVYGFKSRGEYTRRSLRSYDNEKRRIESWLGEYMGFRHTPEGKRVFLSFDSSFTSHNPLYQAWKTKSFTDGDITLHFILMDLLKDDAVTLNEAVDHVYVYLSSFDHPHMYEESTIRKKLNEYVKEGIVKKEKKGRVVYYSLSESAQINTDVLDFYSETALCGVIGSYLLDREEEHMDPFRFKHHYITGTLDSEVMKDLLQALQEKREVEIELFRSGAVDRKQCIIPLGIMCSVQGGRQYVMAYSSMSQCIDPYRLDNIASVRMKDICPQSDDLKKQYLAMRKYMWGVNTRSQNHNRLEHVSFTVCCGEDEFFIPQRLEREKRCGFVEKLDDSHYRFTADVYDAHEMIPWIRTFICRITEIHFSDPELTALFKKDLEDMYQLYDLDKEDGDDFQ